MTAAPSDAPASTQAPPECTGGPERAPVHVITRSMRTQPRPIRIEYMVDPAAFACAVLPEAAALLANSGAGLALKADAVGVAPAAALAHSVAPLGNLSGNRSGK